MGVRVLRRLAAANDAEQVADRIAKDSLATAVRFLENAEATLRELSKSPKRGHPYLSTEPRLQALRYRRVIGFPNHLIFFRVQSKAIEVLRILHAAQDLPTELVKEIDE